jgi:hypothetical protein
VLLVLVLGANVLARLIMRRGGPAIATA